MTEWREVILGQGLRVRHGYAFRGEFFSDGGEQIVLTPGNFIETGGFKHKSGSEKYYTGPVPDAYVLRTGDVVVAMTEQASGLLGSSATIPTDARYLHNQRIGLIEITNPDLLDLRFVYHLMNSRAVREQISATATGAKVRHTAPERIHNVRAWVPSVATQRAISNILDTVDDLIENNRRRVQVLEEMAPAIYREWFVHFRFPGHENVELVDSDLGPIPEGWSRIKLETIAKVNATSRTPTAEEVIRYLDISSLGERGTSALASIPGAEAPGRARRVVRPGDTVWSMVRPNRRAHALLVSPADDWIASTGLAVLTPVSVPSSYLFEAVSTVDFSDYLVSRASGAAYPAVKPKDFQGAAVLLPDSQRLGEFHSAVDPMHRMAWKLRDESASLAAMRDLLLPKLVTGQVDAATLDLDALVEGAVA